MWIHGDLHAANVLVGPQADQPLRAVLDFGDMCKGDPAVDFSLSFDLFSGEVLAQFQARVASLHEKSPLDPDLWRRAQG